MHGAVVNLIGKVLYRRTVAREERTGQDAVALAVRLARELAAATDQPILGVGVGSPGVVDPDGVVLEAANLGWHDVAARPDTSAAPSACRSHVANDANAATLAEYAFGDRASDNLLLVKVGEGVGAGLLIDGQLFTGDRSRPVRSATSRWTSGATCAPAAAGAASRPPSPCPCLRARLAEAADERARLQGARRGRPAPRARAGHGRERAQPRRRGALRPVRRLGEPFREAALATIRRRTIPSVGEHVSLPLRLARR